MEDNELDPNNVVVVAYKGHTLKFIREEDGWTACMPNGAALDWDIVTLDKVGDSIEHALGSIDEGFPVRGRVPFRQG